jgi:hypothetical protein
MITGNRFPGKSYLTSANLTLRRSPFVGVYKNQSVGFARLGFNFRAGEAASARAKGRDWVKDHHADLYSGEVIAKINQQIDEAKTPLDHLNITYKHPTKGEIKVGEEYMKDLSWDGVLKMDEKDPGHALFYEYLYKQPASTGSPTPEGAPKRRKWKFPEIGIGNKQTLYQGPGRNK